MALNKGEERLLTVYADLHYYFSTPTPRPISHRFDKGSYLYLYGNGNGKGGRIEIANNVGKPEQDAFTGNLDSVAIRQSHKHPTLCTITVDGYTGRHEGTTSPIPRPEHHWKLASSDPRSDRKTLLRLHTVDIYLWTAENANQFVDTATKILESGQLEILNVPQQAHKEAMSPVVQQLENIADHDPAYRNGKNSPKSEDAAAYQPLAYNPAAPAAPEPIKHREKTPPPVDAEIGTGLAAAAYADNAQAVSPQGSLSRPPYGQPQSSQGYISPQSTQTSNQSYSSPSPSIRYANPTPSATGHRNSSVTSIPAPPQNGRNSATTTIPTPSFAPRPQSPSTAGSRSSQQIAPAFSPPPQDPNAHFYGKDNKPLESPATQVLGSSYVSAVHQPLQHLQPQYADYLGSGHQAEVPVGGYSNYQYNQHQQHGGHHSHGDDYNIHSQVYRPTEEESRKQKPKKFEPGTPTGKLEQRTEKIDKGVNKFFKKLEKKIG